MDRNLSIPKFADTATALELAGKLGAQFAVVANPQYVFPPYELYPFAPPRTVLEHGLRGAVMDMDGTTTTTEPLCIHSLDTMVRRITQRPDKAAWSGLDPVRDYPHIIGNSTTKHVEYLISAYRVHIVPDALRKAYIQAAAWTLGQGADEGRRREVESNLYPLGAAALLGDERFAALCALPEAGLPEAEPLIAGLDHDFGAQFALHSGPEIVRAAVDIYYQRYHEILARIENGEGSAIASAVFGQSGGHLIEPMPGIGVYLALVKGWLDAEAEGCAELLLAHLKAKGLDDGLGAASSVARLRALGPYFAQQPARVAVVTSSIEYEARIVLKEVFRVLRDQVAQWPVSPAKREFIGAQFENPVAFYDGFVTATDSSEIRLKPHRDLYSIALHRLGIGPAEFADVAGFEDSESGTIAIRAAGIPLCCAVPFHMTQGHLFHAATHTCDGGLPEVILRHRCFLPETLCP